MKCLAVFDRYGSGLVPERQRHLCILPGGHRGPHLGGLVYLEERRFPEWDEQKEETNHGDTT